MAASSVTAWILGIPLSRRSMALKSFFSSFAMGSTSWDKDTPFPPPVQWGDWERKAK